MSIRLRWSRFSDRSRAGVTALALAAGVAFQAGCTSTQTDGVSPHRAILGCTHFPLVEHLFRQHLPPFTRLLSQPAIVADSLEDYLIRRPSYANIGSNGRVVLLTTGDPAEISDRARVFWPDVPAFDYAGV